MIQAAGATMVRMTQNIRIGKPGQPLTEEQQKLKVVAELANVGKAGAAMKVLGEHIVEEKDPAAAAADSWLGLSPEEREATAVFASGRDRSEEHTSELQSLMRNSYAVFC